MENESTDEITDEFAEALLAKLENEGALLTAHQMDELELKWKDIMGLRRCALASTLQPFSRLREKVQEDKNFAMAVADTYLDLGDEGFYRAMFELMDGVTHRLLMDLVAMENMVDLLAEVRAKNLNCQ